MTTQSHPHAAFDRFPQLVRDLEREFGTDGIDATIERFIEAERADFYWDGRLAEMNLGACESMDDANQAFERVAIIGYFRNRYYVAICLVDSQRKIEELSSLKQFVNFETAEATFLASG